MKNIPVLVILLLLADGIRAQQRAGFSLQQVSAQLDTILNGDQAFRKKIGLLTQQFGPGSVEMKELLDSIRINDSSNLVKVKRILDQYGWLGPDKVGKLGNLTLFLVIQHADLPTQQKYLPMMRKAVEDGRAKNDQLALLEDRVAIGEGKRQTYGSQIGLDSSTHHYFILPLEAPEGVDERRKAVGLPTLAEYLRPWKIDWDPSVYKKELPAIEARIKKQRELSQ